MTNKISVLTSARRFKAGGWLLVPMLLLIVSAVYPQTVVPLTNPGFESPVLSAVSGDDVHYAVDGWSSSSSMTTNWHQAALQASPATEGNQFVMAERFGFHLSQEMGSLEADTRYVFSVDIFPLRDVDTDDIEVDIDSRFFFNPYERRVYTVYRPSWLPDQEDLRRVDGMWMTVQVELDTADWPNLVGEQYRVRVSGDYMAIDNAQLIKYAPGEYPVSGNNTYYVSQSDGDDSNDGLTPLTAWQSFDRPNAMHFKPGDSLLLKRGDEWTEELHIRSDGSPGNYFELSSYGDANDPRPLIRRSNLADDKCIVFERPSYVTISDMDCRDAKLGIYLRYHDSYLNNDVSIDNCHFEGNTDPTLVPDDHNYEYSWSNAIWLGGHIWNSNRNNTTILDGLSITNCSFVDCACGYGSGFYYPPAYDARVRNFYMADCSAVDCYQGAFALMNTEGGLIERVVNIGGGVDGWTGSTLGFLQSCRDITIDRCSFGYMDRQESGDGVGFDFEGDTKNCTISNSIFHDNSSAGTLILSTDGYNTDVTITDCVYYNNNTNPWNSEINSEILSGAALNTGSVNNTGLYRRDDSSNYHSNYFDNIAFNNVRQEFFDETRTQRWWEFEDAGDLEGWGTFNDWENPVVENGALTATGSTGIDPYVHSPLMWLNTHYHPYLWLRMSHTSGDYATLFYVTETDPVWDAEKSVSFGVIDDGMMRDYFVDLRSAAFCGVVTQVRLDPPLESGSELEIDHIRFTGSLDRSQTAPVIQPGLPQEMTITAQGYTDGWVLESTGGSETGGLTEVGFGYTRIGDEGDNGRYRTVLSFDTSVLPANAQLVSAQLGITRVGQIGKNPWTYDQHLSEADICVIDMATPYFGSSLALEAQDWQAPATVVDAGHYIVPYEHFMTVYDLISDEAVNQIDKSGTTQFRIRLEPGTNNDSTADYFFFGGGNHPDASARSTLRVKYYLDEIPSMPVRPTLPDVWVAQGQPARTPSALIVLPGTEDLSWSWSDDAMDELAYNVYYAPGNVLPGSLTEALAANSTQYAVDNLMPNTAHSFAVSAVNAEGESSLLQTGLAWTLAQTPAAPEVANLQSQSIDITIGADDNSSDTEYAIYCETNNKWVQPDGTLASAPSWQAADDWGTVTAAGLKPDTNHWFSVRARNGNGIETEFGPSTRTHPTAVEAWEQLYR